MECESNWQERLASWGTGLYLLRWLCRNLAINGKKSISPKIVPLTDLKYFSCLDMKEWTKKSYLADSQMLFNHTGIKY